MQTLNNNFSTGQRESRQLCCSLLHFVFYLNDKVSLWKESFSSVRDFPNNSIFFRPIWFDLVAQCLLFFSTQSATFIYTSGSLLLNSNSLNTPCSIHHLNWAQFQQHHEIINSFKMSWKKTPMPFILSFTHSLPSFRLRLLLLSLSLYL